MKRIYLAILVISLGFSTRSVAQNILPVTSGAEAKFSVCIVSNASLADLKVFRTDNLPEATGNRGIWFMDEAAPEGAVKIRWEKNVTLAELRIFLVKKAGDAGWVNERKKYLLD